MNTETPEQTWHWVQVAGNKKENWLSPGQKKIVQIEQKSICFYRIGDELFASDSKCPHNGASLSMGIIGNDKTITCPLHRFCFDLQSGKNTSGEGYYLTCYPLKFEGNKTMIAFPKKKKFLGLF